MAGLSQSLAKVSLDAGDVGFGVLVGAGGLGLTLGSFAAGQVVERLGIGRVYFYGIALMGGNSGPDDRIPPVLNSPVVRVRAFSLMGGVVVERKQSRRLDRRDLR